MLLMTGSLKRKDGARSTGLKSHLTSRPLFSHQQPAHVDNVANLITSTKQCGQCGKLDNFYKTSNVLYPRCSILLFVVALFPVSLILSCLVLWEGGNVDGKKLWQRRTVRKEGQKAKRKKDRRAKCKKATLLHSYCTTVCYSCHEAD